MATTQKSSAILDRVAEKYEDNDRVDVQETTANGGRIDMLQVTGVNGDMPYTLMYDMFHDDGAFSDSVREGELGIHQIAAGESSPDSEESHAVPVMFLSS